MIETSVKFFTAHRPSVEPHVMPVTEGVWYVWIDFLERMELDAEGGGCGEPVELYFTSVYAKSATVPHFQVNLNFPVDGILFGSVSKRSYHGTFYSREAYEKIVEQLDGEENE
jgi:hypothetical protein